MLTQSHHVKSFAAALGKVNQIKAFKFTPGCCFNGVMLSTKTAGSSISAMQSCNSRYQQGLLTSSPAFNSSPRFDCEAGLSLFSATSFRNIGSINKKTAEKLDINLHKDEETNEKTTEVKAQTQSQTDKHNSDIARAEILVDDLAGPTLSAYLYEELEKATNSETLVEAIQARDLAVSEFLRQKSLGLVGKPHIAPAIFDQQVCLTLSDIELSITNLTKENAPGRLFSHAIFANELSIVVDQVGTW